MVIKRGKYLEKLRKFKDTDLIKVITGVRRSGKTYLMQMFVEELLENKVPITNILQINFESFKYRQIKTADDLYQYVAEHLEQQKGKMYLFFDEIQHVTAWQEAINSFRVDFDCDIYLTGSNASLLSGELATLLTGRYVEIRVYPLSFSEYLEFKNIQKNSDKYSLFMDYLQDGGFPPVVLANNEEVKQSIKQAIFDSVILRDVTIRSQVRDDEAIVRLTEYMLSEIGNLLSANKVANTLKSEGLVRSTTATIINYMDLLTQAFIFYRAVKYDIRGKKVLRVQGKYYTVDTGLRNMRLSRSSSDNLGHQVENVVYLELLRRGYQVQVGDYAGKEIDFIARKGNETHYYQVTLQIPENSQRETQNLKHIPDGYQKTLLTLNLADVGNDEGIEIKYVIDWLLEE